MPPVPTDNPDGAAKPVRARRSRAKAAPDAAPPAQPAESAEPTEAGAPPAAEAAAKPAKRTRARKATAPAEPAVDALPAETPATDAAEAAATEAAPAPRTRRRKAVPADEPAAPAAPSLAAAPAPRTRRRKAADAPLVAEAPEPAALESEADVVDPDVDTPDEWAFAAKPIAAQPTRRPASRPPAVAFTPPIAPPVSTRAAKPAAATPAADAADGDVPAPRTRTRRPRIAIEGGEPVATESDEVPAEGAEPSADGEVGEAAERSRSRRRRGRRGRGRGKGGEGAPDDTDSADSGATEEADDGAATAAEPTDLAAGDDGDETTPGGTRRRRRRRRGGGGPDAVEPSPDDPPRTVVRVREPRKPAAAREDDGVRGVGGSTRLEAKRQRRRDGRTDRKRPSIVTESEFLARREAVERTMLVRQSDDRTQIAVLEDGVLVEHYVTKASATSYAGNVYLGKVQNVLPSMEAAFVDIGKGRNAVLYAGEVNYDASALEGRAPRIEQALKSGQQVLVQVTKDPIGHKGSRLTSQISLPGRYMVYVPEQSMTGISRKLPDTERARLKGILKSLKPEGAGIIIRTAAEGASEEDLTRDLDRLKAQWEVIEKKAKKESAPALLHAEPDLVIKVIRDNFNEDFAGLVVEAGSEYDLIEGYLSTLAPDLLPRLARYDGATPMFEHYRVNEQLQKALDRKVSLPSGGSLVIDRTEAMTVVDVNTGKFTGKGGNLEETVTRNNLEAAEEIVRQMRLRDIGGIIVVDFIDMILESNRDLVTRRLTECLGRDRTKHQVAEITSLGLLQMTRKRISQGLLESFSDQCPECAGRGVIVHQELLASTPSKGKGRSRGPSPASVAAAAAGARESAAADDVAGGGSNGAAPVEAASAPSEAVALLP
ncbi:MAG TPA: Rne/Rng family ribonuclease [Mycobacteriales bacterium]|nr:Rne/Rng family ribonuclease [Mycobacteriales bacterium]